MVRVAMVTLGALLLTASVACARPELTRARYCTARRPQLTRPRCTARWPQLTRPRCTARCCEAEEAADDGGSWRIGRARLEGQWSRSIQRRRRRFLPFASARQWARAMHFTEEDDWRQWIADGEKRNPYVPSYPDEVYADAGWEGWDDFLNGPIEDLSTVLQPGYKRGKWLRGPLSDVPELAPEDEDAPPD